MSVSEFLETSVRKNTQGSPLTAITPVAEDCSVEVFRWGGVQDHHIADVPHIHTFDEILIFNKGGGKHLIDRTWHEVQDASVHFIKVGAEHVLMRSVEADGGTVLFLRDYLAYEPQLPFKQLFFLESHPVLNLPNATFGELWLVYEQLLSEAHKKQHFYHKQSILSLLNTFLVKVAECYLSTYPEVLTKTLPSHPIAQAFEKMVTENFREQKSVEFYARRLFVTPKYLHEISRKYLGKSPQVLIADHTIAIAASRLETGTDSIKKIASELGFSDPAYFSRFFKKHTGKYPSQYNPWNTTKRF